MSNKKGLGTTEDFRRVCDKLEKGHKTNVLDIPRKT